MSKNEFKQQKKLNKQQLKLTKKTRPDVRDESAPGSSFFVRSAESIKGVLYLILAISIFAAVIMGQPGFIVTLEDIIDSMLIATLGKVLIIIIAIALFIYGLKNLRVLK